MKLQQKTIYHSSGNLKLKIPINYPTKIYKLPTVVITNCQLQVKNR